jgi:hypothetical protein
MNQKPKFNLKKQESILNKLPKNADFDILNPTLRIKLVHELYYNKDVLKELKKKLKQNKDEINKLENEIKKINSSEDVFSLYSNTNEKEIKIEKDINKGKNI